jgi:hypothetical protein
VSDPYDADAEPIFKRAKLFEGFEAFKRRLLEPGEPLKKVTAVCIQARVLTIIRQ